MQEISLHGNFDYEFKRLQALNEKNLHENYKQSYPILNLYLEDSVNFVSLREKKINDFGIIINPRVIRFFNIYITKLYLIFYNIFILEAFRSANQSNEFIRNNYLTIFYDINT